MCRPTMPEQPAHYIFSSCSMKRSLPWPIHACCALGGAVGNLGRVRDAQSLLLGNIMPTLTNQTNRV